MKAGAAELSRDSILTSENQSESGLEKILESNGQVIRESCADTVSNNGTKASLAQSATTLVGTLIDLDNFGNPIVDFPGNPSETPISARSAVPLTTNNRGREVVLVFEENKLDRPIVTGLLQNARAPSSVSDVTELIHSSVSVEIDSGRIELKADREIILRCGDSSITLTRAGKVILRGAYLLSRSSGVNRIKGGSVQIN